MGNYQNFKLASYVYAYYIDRATPEKIKADLAFHQKYVGLDKVYLETHRALVNIPEEKMLAAKKIFTDAGVEVSGGITTTAKVGEKKPSGLRHLLLFRSRAPGGTDADRQVHGEAF